MAFRPMKRGKMRLRAQEKIIKGKWYAWNSMFTISMCFNDPCLWSHL